MFLTLQEEHIKDWKREVDQVIPKKPFVLIGNKIDLVDERVVSKKEGLALAEELGASYFETSAKTGENLNAAFHDLVTKIIPK